MTRHLVSFLAGLALVAGLPMLASAAPPEARHFKAHLSGAEEVPARDTDAHGVANFHLSPDGQELKFILVVNNINNVTASHIHSGALGVNGGVVQFLYGSVPAGGGHHTGLLSSGTIVRGVTPMLPALPGANDAERFDALVALLRSGDSYVNVHTNDGVAPTNTGPGDFPGGEVRGQIDPNP